jgi:hypothetical protein
MFPCSGFRLGVRRAMARALTLLPMSVKVNQYLWTLTTGCVAPIASPWVASSFAVAGSDTTMFVSGLIVPRRWDQEEERKRG